MKRFDLLDEYSSVVLPGYAPRRREADETTARKSGARLTTSVLVILGSVLILASLHGAISGDPDTAIQAVAGR